MIRRLFSHTGELPNRLVRGLDESLASGDAAARVLRVAVREMAVDGIVARLNVDEASIEGRISQILREVLELVNVEEHADAIELGGNRASGQSA